MKKLSPFVTDDKTSKAILAVANKHLLQAMDGQATDSGTDGGDEGGDGTGSAVGHYRTLRTSAADSAWSCVCFGAGHFVAVASNTSGATPRAMCSPSGIDGWETGNITSGIWRSVCFGTDSSGTNLFVAVGGTTNNNSPPRTMTSVNHGSNWTTSTTVTSGAWNSICFGNETFIAVGARGAAMHSTNPRQTWTVSSIGTNAWNSVCFGKNTSGNDLFIAVGNSRTMYSENKGQSWTSVTVSGNWQSVCFGNGIFVAVRTGRAMYSTNGGRSWTVCPANAVPGGTWVSVCYNEESSQFIAVARAGTRNCRVMVSEDSRTWTLRASARGGTDPAWQSVCSGNGILVAVASSGAGNRVMTSSPGGSWMQEQSETITAKTLADVGNHMLPIKASSIIAASDSGIAELASRADHTHPLASREIICADNISVAVIDSGGSIAVPVPVTLANATAMTEQLPAGTYSLRTAIQRLVNNVASLFSTKANLASPALTGTPTAPTATAGTNTTQIATTVFASIVVANKANTDHMTTHLLLPPRRSNPFCKLFG